VRVGKIADTAMLGTEARASDTCRNRCSAETSGSCQKQALSLKRVTAQVRLRLGGDHSRPLQQKRPCALLALGDKVLDMRGRAINLALVVERLPQLS
jgi:hypothetical protein